MPPLESKLRVEAPAFCPPASKPMDVPCSDVCLPEDPWALSTTEMCVSPAELEELECVESWVSMMAEFEGMEQDHLIELSLRHADEHKIAQIKAAVMSKGKHKGGHRHGHHKVAQKA